MLGKKKSTDCGPEKFRLGEYIGLRDGDGKVLLSPELCFYDVTKLADGVYAALLEDGVVPVDVTGRRLAHAVYDKIRAVDGGCYVVRRRRMYNLLRADFSEVLRTWVHKIGELHNGFFIIGTTERRSATSATRHLYGLAHVDGTVVFSPNFEKLVWREGNFFYAEKDNHPYIINGDGSIVDLTFEQLPVRMEVDKKVLVEKALDWILSGMRVYYRDSEAPIDARKVYKVGSVIRAGFFVDVSTRLQKLQTKLRFLVYSAHAAPWEEVNDLVVDNPNIAHWGFCTLHANSYYIVLDVYKKGGVTQVALLHIPPAVAKNVSESAHNILNIVKQMPTEKGTLVEVARMLLDRNLHAQHAYDLNDKYLLDCMRHPIGLTKSYDLVQLEPAILSGDAAAMGRLVTELAKDGDIDNFYTEGNVDNFVWHGLEDSVCNGCIYTRAMDASHNGCGRLTAESFRRNYMRGQCEYSKPDIDVWSQAEIDAKYRWSKYQERIEKTSHVYAKNLVNKFVTEHLGGDIDKLVDFNFSTLTSDSIYINGTQPISQSPIIRAFMSLMFDGVWDDLNYESIEHRHFMCDGLHSTAQQLGAPEGRTTFSGLRALNPTPQQLAWAFELYDATCTIGNFWLLPNHGDKVTLYRLHHDAHYCGFADDFVRDMLMSLCKRKDVPRTMVKLLQVNGTYFKSYHGIRGMNRLAHGLLLEGVVNVTPMPIETCANPGEKFFATLEDTAHFYSLTLHLRGQRMVERLKAKLGR
jgi:hypothetical protein